MQDVTYNNNDRKENCCYCQLLDTVPYLWSIGICSYCTFFLYDGQQVLYCSRHVGNRSFVITGSHLWNCLLSALQHSNINFLLSWLLKTCVHDYMYSVWDCDMVVTAPYINDRSYFLTWWLYFSWISDLLCGTDVAKLVLHERDHKEWERLTSTADVGCWKSACTEIIKNGNLAKVWTCGIIIDSY